MIQHTADLAWMGFPLLALGVVQGVVAALLSRRAMIHRRLVLPAVVCLWTAALGSLATGFAYVYASAGLDYELPYRLTWLSWMPIAAFGHLVAELGYPGSRVARGLTAALYALALSLVVLAVSTDLLQEGAPVLAPFADRTGPLGDEAVLLGGALIAALLVLLVRVNLRLPPQERLPVRPLVWGLGLSALTGGSLLAASWLVAPADTALAVWGTLFLTLGVIGALNRQGVFEVDVSAGHLALVLLWTATLSGVQWVLWTWLVPPLAPGAAVVPSFLVVVLTAYAGLPASRRTLDSIDALILSRRRRGPTLQACMRAASSSLDLEQMVHSLSRSLVRDGGISRVAFLLEEEDGTWSSARTVRDGPPLALPAASPLAGWLSHHQRTLTRDARGLPDPSQQAGITGDLDALGADLAVPMICKGRLLGILALGPLANGSSYGEEDLLLLAALADQAAVAVENARLFRSATTDGLTGLLQRAYFLGRLREEMERARRYRRSLALMVLDIDHFKRVNDTFGHAEGDRVLREISNRLRRSLRSSDVACRYGGEEFVILLVETPGDQAVRVAERLRAHVAESAFEQAGTVTVSIGVAEMRGDQSPETLIQQADVAMYQAKRGGRNRVVAWRTRAPEAGAAPGAEPPEPPAVQPPKPD